MTEAIHPGGGDGRSPAARRGLPGDHKGPGAAPEPEILGNRCGNDECRSYAVYPHCNHLDCTAVWCNRCFWQDGACDRSHPKYPDFLPEDAKAEIRQFKPVLEVGTIRSFYTGMGTDKMAALDGWTFAESDLPAWPVAELAAMLKVVEGIKVLPGPDTW